MSAASRSMARRRDGLARNLGSGPFANDNHTGPDPSSALPPEACAMIEPVLPATNKGGRGRREQWKVRFAPRWGLVAAPLTGKAGRGEPLEPLEMPYPKLAAAADHGQRPGLAFCILEESRSPPPPTRSLPHAHAPA